MLTLDSLNSDKFISVFLAIGFAEKALPIWEAEYPEDSRPRKAIEAAKEWLSNPSDAAANAANTAASAAARSANAVAYAAYAAYAAAAAARSASAADAAAYAAYAAYAAAYAANALGVDKETLIHEVILESLEWILQYKIENGQSFAQPELILGIINKEQADKFLFNLEALR